MSGIVRVSKTKDYFVASNVPFNDDRLSWEARGVMGYLLSKPDDWKIMFNDLINSGPAGEHKMKRILRELDEHGYIERTRLKDEEGKFYWEHIVHEEPIVRFSTDGFSTNGKAHDILSTESLNTESYIGEEKKSETHDEWVARIESEPAKPKTFKSAEERKKSLERTVNQSLMQERRVDISEWPPDVTQIVELMAHPNGFRLVPPRKSKRKGGPYSLWIIGARDLIDACAEFGPVVILARIAQEFRQHERENNGAWPFDVNGPGSLVKKARTVAAQMRSSPTQTHRTVKNEDGSFYM